MSKFKTWLEEERGRFSALAQHLGVTRGRISQMADDGVPVEYMPAVAKFTKNKVSIESMVLDRSKRKQPQGV